MWVSEYRIESGLNCGGHAFGGKGALLGPILEEFQQKRDELRESLESVWRAALAEIGRVAPEARMDVRVTVQGGIGTAEENRMLTEKYRVDGTGWGSPFLLVPDVVNIDALHLKKVSEAREEDVHLSDSSPLGVPFWCLKTSLSEEVRLQKIEQGKPGSECPKGFLVSNTEFTKAPICTASRNYQRRKLTSLEAAPPERPELKSGLTELVVAKACICHDLAGAATVPNEIDPAARTAVCCGPNTVYFSQVARLWEMVDHIYGRAQLPFKMERPHMFLKELSLHVDRMKRDLEKHRQGLIDANDAATEEIRTNLIQGVRLYREQAAQLAADKKDEFLAKLEALRGELDKVR